MHYKSLHQKICWVYNYYGIVNLLKVTAFILKLFCQGRLNKEHMHQQVEEIRYKKALARSNISEGLIEIRYLDFKLKISASDCGLAKNILVNKIRERVSTIFFDKILHGKMTILEIGANQGVYLVQEATRTSKDSAIYAFEPHPHNVRVLKENVKLNNIESKTEIIECAVSDKAGRAELSISRSSNWHRMIAAGNADINEKNNIITVNTTTIDSFCKKKGIDNIDLIRMDVEGFESSVIEGGREILKLSKNCMIFMEFHPRNMRMAGKDPIALLETLKDLGFYCFAILDYSSPKVFCKKIKWTDLIPNLPFILNKYPSHMFLSKEENKTV